MRSRSVTNREREQAPDHYGLARVSALVRRHRVLPQSRVRAKDARRTVALTSADTCLRAWRGQAHAQLRNVDQDRTSIKRTSTNSANTHIAVIGTCGETIKVGGLMDRCFLMQLSRLWTRLRVIMADAINMAAKLNWLKKVRLWISGHTFGTQPT